MSAHRTLNDMFRAFDSVGAGRLNDPGDAGTITVTMWGQVCSITTAGASETRVLDAPTKPGILCAVVHDTDGGDFDLTVTDGYNRDGDTGINFADAKDFVVFYSIKAGTSCYWRILAQEGTDASVEEGDFDTLSIGGTALTATAAEINTAADQSVQQLTMGAGFTSGTGGIAVSSIQHIGSIYKTTIFMDLTGLASSTTDLDIIGKGTSAAHFGQITAALCGTLFYGQITCLETPAGGVDDIDFYSATEGTGVFDGGIEALTEVAMRTNGGSWTAAAATPIALTALPAANKYMYAVGGAGGTAVTYTAGQFLIELWGK